MTKIAIPINNNLLSEVFGDCSAYMIYNISNQSVVKTRREVPPLKSISELSKWINQSGITDLIVHYIDKSLINFFSGTKVNLFIGVPVDNPENLIGEYLNGTLKSDIARVLQTATI